MLRRVVRRCGELNCALSGVLPDVGLRFAAHVDRQARTLYRRMPRDSCRGLCL
jgi:hypothetical protein